MPRLLVSKVARITSRSSKSAVSMPTLMPALAITTSGRPCAAMQARPARDDAVDVAHVGGIDRARGRASRPCACDPGLHLGAAPRHQRQPPAGAVRSARQRLADAAGGAGDEDQRRASSVRPWRRAGAGCRAGAAARARIRPFSSQLRAQVVVVHAGGADLACRRCCTTHRQVRAHPLGVEEGMQELAAELDRLAARRRRCRPRASPSSCTSLPSPLASARRACASVTRPSAAMARMRASSISSGRCRESGAAASPSMRSLQPRRPASKRWTKKLRHRVVGLAARRGAVARRRRPTACSSPATRCPAPAAPSAAAAGRSTARRAARRCQGSGARGGGAPAAPARARSAPRAGRAGAVRRPSVAQRASSVLQVAVQQRGVAAAGHQQQVAELARRAVAAAARGDVVRPRARTSACALARRAGEAGARQQRQVGPVVADGRHLGPVQAQRGQQRLRRGQLVVRAVDRVRQAQVGDAPAHRRRIAAGDDHRRDAALRAAASGRGRRACEGLERLAVLADVEAAVGEHAVDIEDRALHAQAAALRLAAAVRAGSCSAGRGAARGIRSPWRASGRWSSARRPAGRRHRPPARW